MDRATSFGAEAAAYHRHRPGYPDEIAALAIDHATGPVRRAIEVGAGTGKATAVFAARGLEIVAVEPDPQMRAVLARQVTEQDWAVEVVAATFEELDPDRLGTFDLLYAAASFHWTEPLTRWPRAASLLRPGGVLAIFGCARELADDRLRSAVEALTTEVLPPAPWTGWTTADLSEARGFGHVVATAFPRRTSMTAVDFVAHLATVSAYLVLPAGQRTSLLAAVLDLLPAEVEVDEDVPLHLARREA